MEFVEKQNDLMLKALILNYRVLTWLCFQATIFLSFNLTSYIGHMSVSLWDNVSHTFMTSVWHWLLASISKLYFHYENIHSSWWYLKLFFSRTTKPITTKICTKHSWAKGIQVFTNEGPHPFPGGDNYEIAKTHW